MNEEYKAYLESIKKDILVLQKTVDLSLELQRDDSRSVSETILTLKKANAEMKSEMEKTTLIVNELQKQLNDHNENVSRIVEDKIEETIKPIRETLDGFIATKPKIFQVIPVKRPSFLRYLNVMNWFRRGK